MGVPSGCPRQEPSSCSICTWVWWRLPRYLWESSSIANIECGRRPNLRELGLHILQVSHPNVHSYLDISVLIADFGDVVHGLLALDDFLHRAILDLPSRLTSWPVKSVLAKDARLPKRKRATIRKKRHKRCWGQYEPHGERSPCEFPLYIAVLDAL